MNKIKIFIYTIVTLLAIFVSVEEIYVHGIKNNINLLMTDYPFRTNILIISIVGIFIYWLYNKFYNNKLKKHWLLKLVSIFFSLFIIFGHSYTKTNSWDLVFGNNLLMLFSIVSLFGFYFFINCIISILFNYIEKIEFKNKTNKWFEFIFEKKPFLISLIVILIAWIPYIVAFYPGIFSPDPSNQVKQYFNIDTHYIEGVVLIDENVKMTNHHPVLHTLMLGSGVKLGQLMGNENLGIFIYTSIQIIFLVSVLSYTIVYMKKLNTPHIYRFITLLIYSLVPVFPLYGMSVVKDVIFTGLVILYIILIFDMIKYKYEKIPFIKVLLSIFLLLMIMMFRNNGIYMIILSFPLLLIVLKKHRIKILLILLVPIIIFKAYTGIILPHFKITEGSIREMLSIPFQQTARMVKEYGDEISEEDKKIIDKILIYDTLGERYNPNLADPVKNQFNKNATKEDLKEYFGVWFKGLIHRPDVYIQATLNNTYGYFYPGARNWYIYYKYDKRLSDAGFEYKYNDLSGLRNFLSGYGVMFPGIPILGLIVNIGFHVWVTILLSVFLIIYRKLEYLVYLLPNLSLILICFASPANTYFRYAMPYVFASLIVIAMFINILNEKKELDYE